MGTINICEALNRYRNISFTLHALRAQLPHRTTDDLARFTLLIINILIVPPLFQHDIQK